MTTWRSPAQLDRGLARRGIQNRAEAVVAGEFEGVINGSQGISSWSTMKSAWRQQGCGGIDVGGEQKSSLAPFTTQMRFWPELSTKMGQPLRWTRRRRERGYVDALRAEICDGGGLRTDRRRCARPWKRSRAAEACGDGRVLAFATESQAEFAAEDGFAGPGKSSGKVMNIYIRASYYDDVWSCGHYFRWSRSGHGEVVGGPA